MDNLIVIPTLLMLGSIAMVLVAAGMCLIAAKRSRQPSLAYVPVRTLRQPQTKIRRYQ
jgi:hypothetical protein